jgi:PAS domain S-box-containing protein
LALDSSEIDSTVDVKPLDGVMPAGGIVDDDVMRHLPLLDLLPGAVYACDRQGVIRYYNIRACELWGREPRCGDTDERFCGAFRLYTADGAPLPHDETPMARAVRTGKGCTDAEVVIERPDGSRIIVLVNIAPVHDRDGNQWGAVNCFQDITQRKQREQELERARQNMEDFFENGAVGLHWVSPEGIILRANRAELELLGYTAEEYIGRRIADFHVDREVIEDVMARLARNEVVQACEARLRAKDGSIRYVLISSSALWEEGRFVHTRCFTRDITPRKRVEEALRKSEAMLRELADAMPQIVWTARPDGVLDYFNRRWQEYTGQREGEARWSAALHPEDVERCLQTWAAAVAAGQPHEVECRFRQASTGEYRWHLGRALPSRDEQGRVVKWFGTCTDIHDLKLAQGALASQAAALAMQTDELARSNADLEDFAYVASHDLKEPLRGISNYSAMLLEDVGEKVDEDSREKLRALIRLSQRMYRLLDALLEYSRIGRAQLALAPTDLNMLVAEVVDTLRPRLDEAGAKVVVASGLPRLRCDAARVGQLLSNLIVNAVKYNEAAERMVEVGCVPGADGDAPVFYVRDNGIGIRPQHCESIFRMFRRLHHRDQYGGGTGVGLTLAKRIVERHGGRIWVESVLGEGSTFYFTLSPARGQFYEMAGEEA